MRLSRQKQDAAGEFASELESLSAREYDPISVSSTFASLKTSAISAPFWSAHKDVSAQSTKDKWRAGALAAGLAATLTAVVNISVGAWGISLAQLDRPLSDGILVEIFHGDCGRTSTMNTWSHLAINVISTCLLAGSNYCMQCLVAPSRRDIDRAHQKRKWLDIGVPSIRNLRHINARRRWLWILLAISSLPLHLLFNSSFFASVASMNYYALIATPEFLQGAYFNASLPGYYVVPKSDVLQQVQQEVMQNPSKFERLENAACIQQYSNDLITNRRSVIVISSNVSSSDSSSLLYASEVMTANPGNAGYSWVCPAGTTMTVNVSETYSYETFRITPCSSQIAAGSIKGSNWRPLNFTAEYCLSEKVEEQCGFYANVAIIWTVVACNIVKLVIMGHIVYSNILGTPLLTIGDAVSSFVVSPDATTAEAGPMSIQGFRSKKCHPKSDANEGWQINQHLPWQAQTARSWFHAVSIWRWCLTMIYLTACICALVGLLVPGLERLDGDTSLPALYQRGFGSVLLETVLQGWDISTMAVQDAVVSSVLVANSPQLVLSFLYFALNTVLTLMNSAKEWSRFSARRAEVHEPKALRTSDPRGQQRSTFFLQLPFRFAVPLVAMSTILHWLISQSIFLVVVSRYGADGRLDNPFQLATCGYSPIAMIFLIICGVFILACALGASLVKLDGEIPIVGSCSAALAAACQVNWPVAEGVEQSEFPRWDQEARAKMVEGPMVWGEVNRIRGRSEMELALDLPERGHCAFISASDEGWRAQVKRPRAGKTYV